MVIVLLFLILCALLFPKALKFLLALAFIVSIVALSEARAEKPLSFRAAEKFCIDNPDVAESGDPDEHFLSIKECAARVVKTPTKDLAWAIVKTPAKDRAQIVGRPKAHVSTKYLITYWHKLDEGCRGGTAIRTKEDGTEACDKKARR